MNLNKLRQSHDLTQWLLNQIWMQLSQLNFHDLHNNFHDFIFTWKKFARDLAFKNIQ